MTESLKERITHYINENVRKEDEEEFKVEELFHLTNDNNGKLTFCGFRNLKKVYDFFEITIETNYSPNTFLTLTSNINGFFYIYDSSPKGTIRMQTTDKKFVNKMKLCKFNFNLFLEKYIEKNSS